MKKNKCYRNVFVLTLTILLYGSHIMAQTSTRTFKMVNDLDAVKQKIYFNFDKGQKVEGADTTGKDWDLVFARTVILVNSGISGKGNTTAQLLKDASFDKILKAPANGYLEDSQKTKAIPWGSNNGWYTYDMTNHSITPIPGRIIIVHTSSGKYVKVEILNYYKNGDGDPGYYTFKYAFIEPEN
ncbi:HmuY family protein [Mucilaginibacter sp. 22184]|uniref:HmuY family protein n=1 Tax=Mucilaginibacter sp. 22184 TaxID=3453887 RepID=UPI003F8647B5